MAVGRHLANGAALLKTFVTLYSYVTTVGESTFGPVDPENNDFFFEGEDVTLACMVSEVTINEVIVFNVTYEESLFIVTNSVDTSEGIVSNFEHDNNEIRFVLPSVEINDTGLIICITSSAMLGIQTTSYFLQVLPPSTVKCKHNSTIPGLSTDTLKLSCYYTASNSMNFAWYQTNDVGETSLLENTLLVEVNGIKSHLISYVQPSDDLTGFIYSCQSSVDLRPDSEMYNSSCSAGSFVVYSKPIVTIKPEVQTISVGETRSLKCEALNVPGISIIPIWTQIPMIENVTISYSGSIINISVSNSTRDGTLINVQCEAFLPLTSITYIFSVTVGEPSATTTKPPDVSSTHIGRMEDKRNESNSRQLLPLQFLIIISCAAAALIVTVVLSLILCWCLCKGNKRDDVDESDTQNSTPVYGKIIRKGNVKCDETQDGSNDDLDYETKRAYDNNEMGSLPIRLSKINDLNGGDPYNDDGDVGDDDNDDADGRNDNGEISGNDGKAQYEDYY